MADAGLPCSHLQFRVSLTADAMTSIANDILSNLFRIFDEHDDHSKKHWHLFSFHIMKEASGLSGMIPHMTPSMLEGTLHPKHKTLVSSTRDISDCQCSF